MSLEVLQLDLRSAFGGYGDLTDDPRLLASVTPQAVKDLYGEWVKGDVACHPMDNIEAVVVVMQGALGGGATRTLRLDQTGKSLGYALLRLPLQDSVV